jgi:NADH-quinone oxidoreductase subunit K
MTGTIPIQAFLIISTLMFFIGIYGFLTRKNLITMLMSIELILNSVNINFVVFNRYLYPQNLQGHFFSLIIIAIAAAEAAVAIAIVINIYRNFRSIDVDNVDNETRKQ